MTHSRTTVCGAIAGAATSLQALPDLPGWFRACATIVASAALIALGLHAADCPPNCPGTDPQGRRLGGQGPRFLAGVLVVLVLAAAICLAALASGCTTVYARSHSRTGEGTNRVDKSGVLYGVTFFDSGQVLGKTKVALDTATNGTWPAGISTAGLDQHASSTGMVTIIQNFPKVVPVP